MHPFNRINIEQFTESYNEAYSQTACRPAKPLVRVHLRKAVNKAHCVGVAFTSESEDRPPPGAEEFFDFSVAELGEVVEDLVVVLVLHDNVLFSQESSCFVFLSLLCALKLIPA